MQQAFCLRVGLPALYVLTRNQNVNPEATGGGAVEVPAKFQSVQVSRRRSAARYSAVRAFLESGENGPYGGALGNLAHPGRTAKNGPYGGALGNLAHPRRAHFGRIPKQGVKTGVK